MQLYEERKTAIHMLRKGCTPREVAHELGHTLSWVYKWQKRFDQEGWTGLQNYSRARKKQSCLSKKVQQAIKQARSELEAEASEDKNLKYIGASAILARLTKEKTTPIPSLSSIERVLRKANMTKPKAEAIEEKIDYPRLRPVQPHQLVQVDIAPHYLRGGKNVACFNGIDVVSRYPTGLAFSQRRAVDARDFLIHVWQEIGIPHYTQVDNESCFSGGFTHKAVLGQVVRLALWIGTELLFSPVRYPESNGFVERFHQDYDAHVWKHTSLKDIVDVNRHGTTFFQKYRHSGHHSALNGQTPSMVHFQHHPQLLQPDCEIPKGKLPLTEGQIHFIRRVSDEGSVSVLNSQWSVPNPDPLKGVWVTINFALTGASLSIYDATPDVDTRVCLATYSFPISETIQPKKTTDQKKTHLMQLPLEIFNFSAKMVFDFFTM